MQCIVSNPKRPEHKRGARGDAAGVKTMQCIVLSLTSLAPLGAGQGFSRLISFAKKT